MQRTLEKISETAFLGLGIVLSVVPAVIINSGMFVLEFQDRFYTLKRKYLSQAYSNDKFRAKNRVNYGLK